MWIPSNANNTTQSLRTKVLRSAVPPSHPHSRSRRPAAASHGSLAVTATRPPAHASSCSFLAAHRSLAITAARPPARASSCSFPIARRSLAVTSARPPVRASYCSSGCADCPDRGSGRPVRPLERETMSRGLRRGRGGAAAARVGRYTEKERESAGGWGRR